MFFRKNFDFEKVLQVAKDAKGYARQQIVKSSNTPDTNDLPEDRRIALRISINASKTAYGIQDLIKNEIKRRIANGEDKVVAHHKSVIDITSKYSLGNCYELAHQALAFIIKNTNIPAEIIGIKNGDHFFVVLNRKSGSDENNPLTWGSDAIICDPWMDAIYPARSCATQLKNYYLDRNTQQNMLEDYDPKKHILMATMFNTDELRPNK